MKMMCAQALVATALAATFPALAQSPGWVGRDFSNKSEENRARQNQKDGGVPEKYSGLPRDEQKSELRDGPAAGRRSHFDDKHRVMVREFYEESFRGGRCPPGLAKKGNGCMPPGQARKWQYGRPLPRDVVYYEVPHDVVVHVGVPPSGYRYVRVAADILMIALATGMVVDAIEDLGR